MDLFARDSAVEPAPEDMNEAQRKAWKEFCVLCKSCGVVAAYQAYKPSFKILNLVLTGVEEDSIANDVCSDDTAEHEGDASSWIRAVHSPHDMCFHVEWNIPHYSADPLDCIYLLEIEHVGTSMFVACTHNHSAVSHGKAVLSFHSEVLNTPGREYYLCYKRRDDDKEMTHTRVLTISRLEEMVHLPGKVTVELLAEVKQLVIDFDLSGVPHFTPRATDRLILVEELNNNHLEVLSVPSTFEISGTTNINFTLELSNNTNYNVRYIHDQIAVAISNVFTCVGISETVNCEDCKLSAGFDPATCTVQISWEFSLESTIQPKQSQSIFLYKAAEVDRDNLQDHQKISILTSGKRTGKACMVVKGAVQNGETYEVHYVEQSLKKWVSYGSTKFFVSGVSEADLDEAQLVTSWADNARVCMRYLLDEAEKMNEIQGNPLLDVVIDKDFSLAKFANEFNNTPAEREQTFPPNTEDDGDKVDDTANKASMNEGMFDPIDESDLQKELFASMDTAPLVVYAGAGCSMSAPSCSPAWWRLVADLIQATFEAAPETLRPVPCSNTDITRQPEEIMESYYYILNDRLLTLFRLLEAGRPNSNHIAIAKLAKAGKVKAIFTTNFDIFIERALLEEGVEFESFVTQGEFETYHTQMKNNTAAAVAVLKIHGTIDRPDTIVAVANHYKMGKGFSDSKALVLAELIKVCPTLFIGYSGWDFLHKNYQTFWKSVGTRGCLGLYWLTLRGMRGGPDLGAIVGAHIGHKLRIGVGSLPDFFHEILERYAPGQGDALVQWAAQVDMGAETDQVHRAQATFLKQWVASIPPATLLSLVMLEAERLSVTRQHHAKKNQLTCGEAEAGVSSVDTHAAFMKIAMDLQSGVITPEEYADLIAAQTLKTTFQHLAVNKSKKNDLVMRCMQAQRSHPLLKDDPMYKSLLPSLVLSASFALPSTAAAEEYMKASLDYLELMNKFKNSFKPRDKIMLDTYMFCSLMLSGTASEQQQIHCWVDDFATTCLVDKWSSEEVMAERSALSQRISNLCNGKVDIQQILEEQIRFWFTIPDDHLTEILECGLAIALALVQQSENRSMMFAGLPGFASRVSNPLMASATVPHFVFQDFENKFNKMLLPVFERLNTLKANYSPSMHGAITVGDIIMPCPSPEAVLAAFDISSLLMWYPACKHLGEGPKQAEVAAHKGFYPTEGLPASLCTYLVPRALASIDMVTDPRLAQPLLALMTKLGESLGDFALIKQATEASLALTEGKVTELTPPPIPEALANAYQQRGELTLSLHWYELALDGVKTCVARHKTDAIVLNACLVAAKCGDIKQALRFAFKCSPQFATVTTTAKLGLLGPGRPILCQQMLEWCRQLGYKTVRAAEIALMSSSLE